MVALLSLIAYWFWLASTACKRESRFFKWLKKCKMSNDRIPVKTDQQRPNRTGNPVYQQNTWL